MRGVTLSKIAVPTAIVIGVVLWTWPRATTTVPIATPIPRGEVTVQKTRLLEPDTERVPVLVEEAQTAPAEGTSQLIVRPMSNGNPILDATVLVYAPSECIAAGRDEEHRYVLPVERLVRMQDAAPALLVGAPHHSAVVKALVQTSGEIVVDLEPALEVTGSVTLEDGTPPSCELTVVAWPGCQAINIPLLREVIAGVPAYPAARTDKHGAFRLKGLKRGVPYTVACGGGGFVSKHNVFGVTTASQEPLTLVAWRMFGCATLLRDQDGQQIVASSFASYQSSATRSSTASLVTFVSADLVLAGIALPDGTGRSWHDCCLVKAAVPEDSLRVTYVYNVLGYEETQVELQLGPLTTGRMPRHEVRLRRWAEGFGDVHVDVGWKGHAAQRPFVLGDAVWTLMVTPLTGASRLLTMPLVNLREPGLFLQGMPVGSYHLSLVRPNAEDLGETDGIAKWTVDVNRGSTARVECDLGHLCCLAIEVRDSLHGDLYEGPLRLTLRKAGGLYVQMLFARRPYRLDGLQAGVYALEVSGSSLIGGAADDLAAGPLEVVALSGQTVEVATLWSTR